MQSVLAKLSLCRTRALGGKTYQCDECNSLTEVEGLNDSAAWKKFCDELAELDWVSFIQPPPTESCDHF